MRVKRRVAQREDAALADAEQVDGWDALLTADELDALV